MKIYNVLFEDNDRGDVKSFIESYSKRTDAVGRVSRILEGELEELTEEETERMVSTDGDDFFCVYSDEDRTNWKSRCTVYETELI